MLDLDEAQARLLALAPVTGSSQQAVAVNGNRRWLASDHLAKRTQPPADLSAMDGYAICGDGPWTLTGESRAGAPFAGSLGAGQCTRISTGAHMPQGSQSVLIQENARVEGAMVHSTEPPPPAGRHVRKAGFDFAAGDVVLPRGAPVTPATIALAISAGYGALDVVNPPSVAVLDSGDELVPAGEPCADHQIPASNGVMLAAMVQAYVGGVKALGPVPDDRDQIAAALEASGDCDILITSGGASVGDHDLIQQSLIDWGADLNFWKVAIKPGKPLMVATRERKGRKQVILGLPGNPVSSFVTCFLFALPLIRASMGAPDPLPRSVDMVASEDLAGVGSRHEFVRGVAEQGVVRLASSQDSSALQALANANCLIDRPAGSPPVCAGEQLRVFCL